MFGNTSFSSASFSSLGSFDGAVTLTGLEAEALLNSVGAGVYASVYPDGIEAGALSGTLTVTGTANLTLTGVDASGELASITVYLQKRVLPTGVDATGEVDSVAVIGAANVFPTGNEVLALVNDVYAYPVTPIYPTAFTLSGDLGTVTAKIDKDVFGFGSISAKLRQSNVLVWDEVNTAQTTVWTNIVK